MMSECNTNQWSSTVIIFNVREEFKFKGLASQREGLNPLDARVFFCVEFFAHSPRICMGPLWVHWLLPTVKRHAYGNRQIGDLLTDLRYEWLFIYIYYPCNEPASCAGCAPPLSQRQLAWLQPPPKDKVVDDEILIQNLKLNFHAERKWHQERWWLAAEAVNKAEHMSWEKVRGGRTMWEKPEGWRRNSCSTESADRVEVSMAC